MIAPGEQAFCLVQTKPTPSGRRELLGAARVEVIDAGQPCRVRILRASGPRICVGDTLEMNETALYPVEDREACTRFAAEVDRFWGPASRKGAW